MVQLKDSDLTTDGTPNLLFQFLMVQLKEVELPATLLRAQFQFLMVQLKVIRFLFDLICLLLFQFLMVQLKVEQQYNVVVCELFQFLMVQLKA